MKLKKILFTCFTFILLFNIGLTNAKYASLEYGDIFNVKLSKYTTNVEFEIDKDTEKNESGKDIYWESGNLWGAGEPTNGNQNLNNWEGANGYFISNLEEVAFSAKNSTNHDVMIIFEITIIFFKNSNVLMNFIMQNTATSRYQYLTGCVNLNKGNPESKYFPVSSNLNYKNYNTQTFTFNPYDYYKKTELINQTLDFGDKDNDGYVDRDEYSSFEPYTASAPNEAYEKPNLLNSFILQPGEIAEFNISPHQYVGNGSTEKSIYSEIKMKAIVSPYSTNA